MLAFSPSGAQGVLGTESGSVYATGSTGANWRQLAQPDLGQEAPLAAVVREDGVQVVIGRAGTVWVSNNGEWRVVDELSLEGPIRIAEFSPNGTYGVIGDSAGSVYVSEDPYLDWTPLQRPGPNETALRVWVTDNGVQGVVDREGNVFILIAGDWHEVPWEFESPGGPLFPLSGRILEWPSGGSHALIEGSRGALYVTDNGGSTWRALQLPRDITMVAFNGDGSHGVVGSSDGSVHVTRTGGLEWSWLDDVTLTERDAAQAAWVGTDGPQVIVGAEGTVWTLNAGEWNDRSLNLRGGATMVQMREEVLDGLIGGTGGQVYRAAESADDGVDWLALERLDLLAGESAEAAWTDENGQWLACIIPEAVESVTGGV